MRDSGGWAVRAREYMPGEEDRKALCAVRVCVMPGQEVRTGEIMPGEEDRKALCPVRLCV